MTAFNTLITQEGGQDLKAYVAKPTSNNNGAGIILMHEVYGVTDGIHAIADKFAAAGFTVACPNMYWRIDPNASFKYHPAKETLQAMQPDERAAFENELADDRESARQCMFNTIGEENGTEKILDTINKVSAWLRNEENCKTVASTGFCFGGRNTYLAAAHGADIDAGIAFYATPKLSEVFDKEATQGIAIPFMFVVGGEDPYISDFEKQDVIVDSSGTTLTYVAGRKTPIIENNDMGNTNLLALYYANSNHGFNRKESSYSDPGTSDHVMSSAITFFEAALLEGKFKIPLDAVTTTPNSTTYHPKPKL